MPDIKDITARSGRVIRENNTVVNEADGMNDDGSRKVALTGSTIQLPVDIQSRLAATTQTHNAVSVAASSNSVQTSFMDTNGFAELAVNVFNDAATSSQATIYWSHDGATVHAEETVLNSTQQKKATLTTTKARYAKIKVDNLDGAAAHTMSAWAYLKA